MIVELEADGIHFRSSSPAVTRKLLENGARIVAAAARAEDLGSNMADSAIPTEEPAQEELRAPRG